MQKIDDYSYGQGQKMAGARTLKLAIQMLGYEGNEFNVARLLSERAETVTALRDVCEDYGDNDWDDNLHLADVIEKHLHRQLAETLSSDGRYIPMEILSRGGWCVSIEKSPDDITVDFHAGPFASEAAAASEAARLNAAVDAHQQQPGQPGKDI